MKLSPASTTARTLFKLLALLSFTMFPIVGYLLGMEYQRILNATGLESKVLGISAVCATPPSIYIPAIGSFITTVIFALTFIAVIIGYFIKKKKGQDTTAFRKKAAIIFSTEIIIGIILYITTVITTNNFSCNDVLKPINMETRIVHLPQS